MEETGEISKTSCTKSDADVSRTHSQDGLDSSSTSSLSCFADHTDMLNSSSHTDRTDDKSEECSSKAPMDEALKSEKAFIEFVMSLPQKDDTNHHHHKSNDSVSSKIKTSAATGSTSKVGLDHLDNLCKLMEQLSDLRETNNKLQRRVQYLEDLKTLHDMHKEINEDVQYTSEDVLPNKPRGYELQKSATETCCPKKEDFHVLYASKNPFKYQNRRSRHQSVAGQRRERSKSVGHEDAAEDTKSKRIFPKWSRVKEAFGWESDRKDSVKIKIDGDARNFQVPRRSSEDSRHSLRQPNPPTWYQEYPSLHSSLEDINEILETGGWKRCSLASEKNILHIDTPKEALRRQKSTPSPGSEKLSSSRETSDLKPKSSTIERDIYAHPDYGKFDKDDGKRGKSPWGRVKTIIEKRRDSLKRRSLRRQDHACVECSSLPLKKVTEALESRGYADYMETTVKQTHPSDSYSHKNYPSDIIVTDQEVDYGGPRSPSPSPSFHRTSRWTRMKKVLKGKKEDEQGQGPSLSTPTSPNSTQDGHFSFDINEDALQETYGEGREIKRVGSDSHVHQMALSGPASDLMLQLQRNLSDDFHKKIMEWERMRSSGTVSCSPQWDRKTSMTIRSRKKSERDDKGLKPKLKDLTWLEKELQKIEKEKQRLSKEKQKYEERALRLEKLRETVLNAKNSNKREVLVKTSAGEFRFEGISDAFTKKLYEWETKRGLGPELSTIALLDSSRLTISPSMGPKSGPLQRVVSRSESSIADIGQPSQNSSNSLPSLKIPDASEVDRGNQPSRANSEPDLAALVAITNANNVSVTNLSKHVNDSIEDEITNTATSRGSEDELDKKRKDSETYYGLLEENVILLEQLKDKEEICRRLQDELEVLDKKVDFMDKHHSQETERYREKLWEMHKPGATPRDVQCCLRTMSQLRKRIEVLEKCTEKLRNDRESVEDSFRYHSKQQEDMTLDLLQKMSELQAAGSSTTESGSEIQASPQMDVNVVERLQDLSSLLVKQTQELQETLSAKTRQICELRWELLHRDLSTVKLETELHTHTAHRKRSKYANYRSHSSEEAPAAHFPEDLNCGKSTIITEAYYNASTLDSEFKADQLTSTVQELNREVLKLASATEHPYQEYSTEEAYTAKNNDKFRNKSALLVKGKDSTKQAITVRRSSADSINAVLGANEKTKHDEVSSDDSDDSSDDGYIKVFLTSSGRHAYSQPPSERLLMPYGEYPPRHYLQKRKKLQKMSQIHPSPNRRRSKTFHNKRDFEKLSSLEMTPQKCHSFRLPNEKCSNHADSKSALDALNIRTLLGEVKYQEFMNKKTQMCLRSNHPSLISANKSDKIAKRTFSDAKENNQWIREVASDSKIPFLFQLQYCKENHINGKKNIKHPVRSMSDKSKKETAAEKREYFQKRKNRKQSTSPNLFSDFSESVTERLNAINASQNKTLQKNIETCKHVSDIPSSNTDAATITIHLPKKKLKRHQPKSKENTTENPIQTFTLSIPPKRSLTSEKEMNNSAKNNCSVQTNEVQLCEKNSNDSSLIDSQVFKEIENTFGPSKLSEFQNEKSNESFEEYCNEDQQAEQISRKRKAEDEDSSFENCTLFDKDIEQNISLNITKPEKESLYGEKVSELKCNSMPNYTKSPSAPHLDWRKACAKKVQKEEISNVRSLIEKYNKVAENQSSGSKHSSNVNSPACIRKTSSPLCNSKSDYAVPTHHSFSTPTTPSVITASSFYNPLTFRPVNLELFQKSPSSSPMLTSRNEALRKAKEKFISSQHITSDTQELGIDNSSPSANINNDVNKENYASDLEVKLKQENENGKKTDDDRVSNCSMDSMSLVMFRTGETCKESRLSKRSVDYSKTESDTLSRQNLKTSKSLSNSSLFKTVLSSDFRMPSTLLRLTRSKRKKDMSTVSHLCRQSLLLTSDDDVKIPSPSLHKSCPSSPELKTKSETKSSWFQRNILRHK